VILIVITVVSDWKNFFKAVLVIIVRKNFKHANH